MCSHCDKGPFKGQRGLSQHMRRFHTDDYHEMQESKTFMVQARWSQEEMTVVALAIRRIDQTTSQAKQKEKLHCMFPERTVESFKGLRRNKDFIQTLKGLDETHLPDGDVAPQEANDVAAHPHEGQGTLIDEGKIKVTTPTVTVRTGLPEALDMKWLASPGEINKMSDEELQQFVEQERAAWRKTIPRRQVKTARVARRNWTSRRARLDAGTSTRDYRRCS